MLSRFISDYFMVSHSRTKYKRGVCGFKLLINLYKFIFFKFRLVKWHHVISSGYWQVHFWRYGKGLRGFWCPIPAFALIELQISHILDKLAGIWPKMEILYLVVNFKPWAAICFIARGYKHMRIFIHLFTVHWYINLYSKLCPAYKTNTVHLSQ